jgi:hypothetical protein
MTVDPLSMQRNPIFVKQLLLEEFEETRGQFRRFESRHSQIFVMLSSSWSVLIPNSSKLLQLLQTLKKGDYISICRTDNGLDPIRVKKL